jgi:hypothetical protein
VAAHAAGFKRRKSLRRQNPLQIGETEGEGFEPSTRRTTGNGFRDRLDVCPLSLVQAVSAIHTASVRHDARQLGRTHATTALRFRLRLERLRQPLALVATRDIYARGGRHLRSSDEVRVLGGGVPPLLRSWRRGLVGRWREPVAGFAQRQSRRVRVERTTVQADSGEPASRTCRERHVTSA